MMGDRESAFRRFRVFCAAVLAACLNGVAVGHVAGWPQAAIPKLLSPSMGFTDSEASTISGILFLGMLVGGFISMVVAGRFGKRKLFIFASVPLALGWSIVAAANSFWQFVVGRIVIGLGSGMMCHQTEMYLSEISTRRLRSSMSVMFCASIHIGVLQSFIIGPMTTISTAVALYLAVVLLFASLYIFVTPETPFWLLKQGRPEEALESLRRLRGKGDVHLEFEQITEFVEKTALNTNCGSDGIWINLRRGFGNVPNRKAILLVVLLTTAQQFSGMAAMYSYAELSFEKLGSSIIRGRYVSLLLGLIEFCCTFASGCLVERVGRRFLVTSSSLVCAGSMILLGLCFRGTIDSGILPIIFIIVFALSYGLGLATMATIIAAECLSMDARNLCAAAQNTTVCVSIFFITKMWQVIATSYGQEYSFWTAGIITVLHTIVLLIMLPETRGKTLVEIQRLLESSSTSSKPAELLPRLPNIRIVPTGQIVKSGDVALR